MNSNKNQQQKRGKRLKQVAALSGLAFQLAVITGIGAYVGYKLDEHYTTREPIYTIIGTFIGFGIAMYFLVKQVNKFSR